jgi:hypothetical protein
VVDDVEVGVAAHLELERVGVGHEVPAHAVGVDELHDPGRLAEVALVGRLLVGHPLHGDVRDAQRGEDVVVEAVLAEQQLVHAAQELTGLRALDDAVVVRAREGDRLADREPGERLLGRALELGRVLHRPDADDRAGALHEARDRVHRADAAGLVRLMVVPWKSSVVSLPARARRTMSSYAAQNCAKSMRSAPLIAATTSERVPLAFCRSIASPSPTPSGVTSCGLPSGCPVSVV